MATLGGRAATPLKNEKGETLVMPASDTVEISAIGRGTIVAIMSAYTSRAERSPGSIVFMAFGTCFPRAREAGGPLVYPDTPRADRFPA